MDRQTQELIRQHTFVCLALANNALHVAHEEFHRIRDVYHAAPTAENYTALLNARSRLSFAMTIRAQADLACAAQDKFPPHPFFYRRIFEMIVPLSVAFFPEESDDQDVVVHYRLTCDHDDCQAEAIPCFISPDFEVEEKDHYCPAHAPIHGFCAGCGIFVGVFENSPCLGYCPDCAEEKLAEELSIPSLPALKIMPLFISLPVDGPKLEDVDIDW